MLGAIAKPTGEARMGVSKQPAHKSNRLLAALAPEDMERLLPALEIVQCEHRSILVDAGERITRVHFPQSAVICLMAVMSGSDVAEVATVGPEGMVGFEALLGSERATTRTLVQVPGTASRVDVSTLRKAMEGSPALRALFMRYVSAFMAQVTQSVACNRLHKLQERCCRWLLMAHDRAGRDSFPMTQEFLADMLGVHRPGLTITARALQDRGLIRYHRGVLTIVDRDGLEQAACQCYGTVRQAYARIISRRSLTKVRARRVG
jgi:CRP-like cAMP-binding protein